MQFVYQGFTHEGDTRSFTFHGMEQYKLKTVFSIQIDLPLFAQHQVAMQDCPMFCLQMLTAASEAGPLSLERFHQYRVVEEDLRPLLNDREKRAALKALKPSPRRFVRKPQSSSQFRGLGAPEPK
jgi:hypothetical protein